MGLSSRIVGLLVATCITIACARPIIENRPESPEARTSAPLDELWSEPTDLAGRNLLSGSARPDQSPSKDIAYKVLKVDTSGYSRGYNVIGADGRAWDIKVGKEAQTEVVMSRILWALGYHQPATYYLTGWTLEGTYEDEGAPARFRLQSDHETEGEWAWRDNPFNNSKAFHALIAINVLLSNWDYKTSNNRIYRTASVGDSPVRRYVVQDLGASLGKPRLLPVPIGTRNDIDDFEGTALIKSIRGSEVTLDYRGLRGEILEVMSVADVIRACELMNRLSDAQLDDAFKAAEYEPTIRARFIAKIRDKIREGLALRSTVKAAEGQE